MVKQTIGRAPIHELGVLLNPYDKDNSALILPAEDFTVSINTISLQLYTKYKALYEAGRYDNDYFAVVSQMGLGDRDTPILKAHYLNHIDRMTTDVTDIWAENVAMIEDFQKDEKAQRLYLSFSSFCQDLGKSTLEQVTDSLRQVAKTIGSAFPNLVPYTTFGRAALKGVNNIIEKALNPYFCSEVKTSTFCLYPAQENHHSVIGEAPLQTGSYAFFFEPVELNNLRMEANGTITSLNNDSVSPYIVVNIKKGITLAPAQIEKNLAEEVLQSYSQTSSYRITSGNTSLSYFRALEELGKTIRLASSTKRYFELKHRGDQLTEAEVKRLEILSAYLKDNLDDFESVLNS